MKTLNVFTALMGLLVGAFSYGGNLPMMGEPRGIRNNNPGNIRLTRIDWEGKIDDVDNTDREFEQFVSPYFGLRAMARNLKSYQERGVTTIAGIIAEWAPPVGLDNAGNKYKNDTFAYINSVSRTSGIAAGTVLAPSQIKAVMKAMIRHENGMQPYGEVVLDDAIKAGGWVVVPTGGGYTS